MFDRSARWYFPGQDVGSVMQNVMRAGQSYGLNIHPAGPNRFEGRGQEWTMGVSPKALIYVQPDQQGFWLDVRLNADFSGGGIAIMVAGWLFCFPAAIVYIIVANNGFTSRAEEAMAGLYHPVQHLSGQPPMPTFGAPPQGGWR